MKFPSALSKLTTNKYFMYFIMFLSASNIVGYLVTGKINAIVFFGLIALISYHFNKNITIVLGISLILTSLLMSKQVYEGMTNQTESANDTKETNKKDTTTTDEKAADDKEKAVPAPSTSTEKTKNKKLESMNTNGDNEVKIDYASTIEGAYDNLDKMLGSDGINKLTQDTQKLMSQQQKLFDTMQTMAPALENAKEMLKGFDMKGLNSMLNTDAVK